MNFLQIVMEEDESESAVEMHERLHMPPSPTGTVKTLGLTANSQRAFESEREYKVSDKIIMQCIR